MLKKTILSVLVAATFTGSSLMAVSVADAQQFDGPRHGDRDWHGGPPPPPPRHHHHGNGGAIAGGVAAGILGGIIGGALADPGGYDRAPPPPPPRCWFEDRQVQNAYDGGWHYERVRVCD